MSVVAALSLCAGASVFLAGTTGITAAGASTVQVLDRCANTDPPMPPSSGTETPSGFTIQMHDAVLAPSSDANTLAVAYYEWNDMKCSEYTHQYQWQPPDYYYYDCVGFTGYTTSVADPTAWQSVQKWVPLGRNTVPSPYAFMRFFQSLPTTPQPGWQAVDSVADIQPGDILAWQPGSPGQPDLQGVGHSVMPLTAPQPVPGSNDTKWELVIMDSTAGGHGPDDTRQNPQLDQRNAPILTTSGKVEPSGLGIGTIVLDTNSSGQVNGVDWSVGAAEESIDFGAGHPLDDPGPTPTPTPTPGPNPPPASYDLAQANGVVTSYGTAYNYGPTSGMTLNQPVVGLATTTDGNGYWEAAADGGVFAFGTAPFQGSMGGQHLNAPVVGIAGTRDMNGYWEAAADGGVFAFGDAPFDGSMGGQHLNAPVVGIATDPNGRGYWEVGADGGVYAFGGAPFYGSMGGQHLNQPVVGIVPTPDGGGYWLVAKDGGVFAFGNAGFYGSMAGQTLDAPVVSVASTWDGQGYWEFAADGGVFGFGDASYAGGLGGSTLTSPVAAGSGA
jgi:hypothetical protein